MGYLEKNFLLHERGEDKKVLPIDRDIEGLGTVRFIPFARGEFLTVSAEVGKLQRENKTALHLWDKFVLDHMDEPKLTVEDLKHTKPIYRPLKEGKKKVMGYQDLVMEILLPALKEVSGMKLKTLEEEEEEIKKS